MEVEKVEANVFTVKHPVKNCNLKRFHIENAQLRCNFKLIPNGGNVNGIQSIRFYCCNLVEFPRAQILLDLVKDLTSLYIMQCNLTKITCDDLHGLGSLKELYVTFNSIESLPKGLFKHTPNLEMVSFWHNRIKEIDENILDPLKKLKYFYLMDNLKINVAFDNINNKGNVTLAQLKQEIRKCRPTEEIIKDLKRENNNLRKKNAGLTKEVETLKKNHKTIRKDFAQMKTEISQMKRETVNIKLENQNLRITDEVSRKEVAELKTSVSNIKTENIHIKLENQNLAKIDELLINDVYKLKTNYAKLTAELKDLKITNVRSFIFTVVVNGKDFQVNKDILATNSPVLAKLIEENHDADRLVLRDITEETFEEIHNFMMTKNPPREAANLIELYAASARLEMKDLMELTAEILMDKVNPENAPDIIKMSSKYNHEELTKKALSELNKKFGEN